MRRQTPPSLTALGGVALPEHISVQGRPYTRKQVFKNDFFAITALYEGQAGRVVLKVHRQAHFLLFPMAWVGRFLAAREEGALSRLDDVAGVPRLIVRWGPTGIVREFIEGHPLRRGERVADDFHAQLRELITRIHRRGMAYVDLEKAENVLVGADGRPYLFDFQICWYVSAAWGGELWLMRKIRQWLQDGDLYHLGKLQRRTRPDQLSCEQKAATYRKPWYVGLYCRLTRPFTLCRRRVLDVWHPRRGSGERGRIPEDPVTVQSVLRR